MPNNVDNIIKQFIMEVSNLIGDRLKKVILYGSYARGDFKRHKDVIAYFNQHYIKIGGILIG